MQKQTKLYAQYQDHNFGHKGQGVEVADFENAVQLGLEVGSPRFKTFEISSVEIDGETYSTEPKNHSADIYLGFDLIASVQDYIIALKSSLQATLDDTSRSEMSKELTVKIIQQTIDALETGDPDRKFVCHNVPRPEYIELNDGDMVFDRQGQKLWPKPENKGFVKIHYPASDAPEI